MKNTKLDQKIIFPRRTQTLVILVFLRKWPVHCGGGGDRGGRKGSQQQRFLSPQPKTDRLASDDILCWGERGKIPIFRNTAIIWGSRAAMIEIRENIRGKGKVAEPICTALSSVYNLSYLAFACSTYLVPRSLIEACKFFSICGKVRYKSGQYFPDFFFGLDSFFDT